MRQLKIIIGISFILFILIHGAAAQETYGFVEDLSNNPNPFYEKEGIAVDSAGYIYVTTYGLMHIVEKLNFYGGFVDRLAIPGSGNGSVYYPHGVAVDSAGYVYVADSGNNRTQKFDSHSNRFVTTWGSRGSGDGQFAYPYGIAVDSADAGLIAMFYVGKISQL